jgi:RNA polymerase sigma factor (sigma-70 family)
MTRDEAEEQDLMQEAFMQLFQKLNTFQGESTFYTWLYRLAVNVVPMELRRKRRRREDSPEGLPDPHGQGHYDTVVTEGVNRGIHNYCGRQEHRSPTHEAEIARIGWAKCPRRENPEQYY